MPEKKEVQFLEKGDLFVKKQDSYGGFTGLAKVMGDPQSSSKSSSLVEIPIQIKGIREKYRARKGESVKVIQKEKKMGRNMLKKNLMKLGKNKPKLREDLEPILDYLFKKKVSSNNLSDFKSLLLDLQKEDYSRGEISDLADELYSRISHSDVFYWNQEFEEKMQKLLKNLSKESQEILKIEEQQKIHDKYLEPLSNMKDKLSNQYDYEHYLEKKKENLKFRLKKDLQYLNSKMGPEPSIIEGGNTLQGGFRAEEVQKEFDRQKREQWEKAFGRAENLLEKMKFQYDEIVKDYELRRGDKNYVQVSLELKR